MNTRVLIVDDNLSLAEDLAEILEDEGYTVEVASDSRQVARRVDELVFDVALVDMRMPGLDGIALHGVLRSHHPQARYLLMTAYSSDDRVKQGLAAGVQRVLPKPLPLEELLGTLPPPQAKLLVVEDDVDLAQNLAEALSDAGYRVRVATSVAQAAQQMDEPVDAAVVDLVLPDGSGLDVARQLLEHHEAPVVLISGHRDLEAEAADNVRTLGKPFAPDVLLEELKALRPRKSCSSDR